MSSPRNRAAGGSPSAALLRRLLEAFGENTLFSVHEAAAVLDIDTADLVHWLMANPCHDQRRVCSDNMNFVIRRQRRALDHLPPLVIHERQVGPSNLTYEGW